MSRDRVTPEIWERIIERDAWFLFISDGAPVDVADELQRTRFRRWLATGPLICMVAQAYIWLMRPDDAGTCRGPQTVEHVKDHLRMGRRAPSDERHLVACCWYHNVDRPPSKEVRELLREHLERVNR